MWYNPAEPHGSEAATIGDLMLPEEAATTEEAYSTGIHILQYKDPRADPAVYFRRALTLDETHIPARVALAEIHMHRKAYGKAAEYLLQAEKLLTRWNRRPESGKVFYLPGCCMEAQEHFREAREWYWQAAVVSDTANCAYTRIAAMDGQLQDWEGYTFTILNCEDNFWSGANHILDYDGSSGEAFETAIFQRNLAMEEQLHIDIVVEKGAVDALRGMMRESVLAGLDTYDAVYCCLNMGGTSFDGEYSLNLYDIDTLQLSQPWWNQAFIQSATTGDKQLYTTIDYINMMGFSYANGMFFNKDKVIEHGLDMPYDLVRDGKWTYDAMYTYTVDIGVVYGWSTNFLMGIGEDIVKGNNNFASKLASQSDSIAEQIVKIYGE